MNDLGLPEPDYEFWAKVDTWSMNQAAFLLHGIEPQEMRSIRLSEKDVPRALKEVQKTYFILHKLPWASCYQQYYFPKLGAHPAAIIFIARQKKLPLPEPLYQAIAALPEYQHLEKNNHSVINIATEIDDKNKPLTTRERNNLLKTIGVLVRLHFDEKSKSAVYKNGNKLNASQIAQTLLTKAEELQIETKGLESLDRKITEALKLLEEDSG